jgi:alpha/beta superfamily hydrolase
MAKAPQIEKLEIDGPAGKLEAMLESPAGEKGQRIAVLCHPHPQHQGTMHNKVMHTMARALNDLGIPALRFNFRGVGSSEGAYAEGDGELEDVVAVAEYVRQRWTSAELWLGGFSFGAVIAARSAARVNATQLITIAPAVNFLGRELERLPNIPWLILQGDQDEIVPVDEVVAWVDQIDPGPELVVLENAGHFFHGHLIELRQAMVANLTRSITRDR